MITVIPDAPDNVAAFHAQGEITKDDFENLVFPQVKAKVTFFDELNYLLYLDTDLSSFSAGAWVQDIILGLKNLTKWNRCAIVTDKVGVQDFTDAVGVLMPGEFKSFPKEDLANALFWCAHGDEKTN